MGSRLRLKIKVKDYGGIKVGLRSSNPLRVVAIQTIDTSPVAVIYSILIF